MHEAGAGERDEIRLLRAPVGQRDGPLAGPRQLVRRMAALDHAAVDEPVATGDSSPAVTATMASSSFPKPSATSPSSISARPRSLSPSATRSGSPKRSPTPTASAAAARAAAPVAGDHGAKRVR